MRITYVGMTGHLWMVTKGRLPAAAHVAASGTDGRGTPAPHANVSISPLLNNSGPGA